MRIFAGVSWLESQMKVESLEMTIFSSFQEWANAMARRPSSVCLSLCKLLRKSLPLAHKWPDRHQTFTRWTTGQRASSVCSRSRSKVKWYGHFCVGTKIASSPRQMAGSPPNLHMMDSSLQVSVHPGCAQGQGQGQRSRDTRTFLDSWNELLRHWRPGRFFCSLYLPNFHIQGHEIIIIL